jgi:hypothetical protein
MPVIGAVYLTALLAGGALHGQAESSTGKMTLIGVQKDSLVAFLLVDSCGILTLADSNVASKQMPVVWKSGSGHYQGHVRKVIQNISVEPAGDADYYEYGLVDAGKGQSVRVGKQALPPVSLSRATYLPILESDYKKKHENTCNLQVMKAYKKDFDGNGTDEVLFCTRSKACGDTAGATILVIRSVDKDSVRTAIIAREKAQTRSQGPCYFADIDLAFIDVNFDGRLEIFYRFAGYHCDHGLWDTYKMIQFRDNIVIDRRIHDIDRLLEMYAQ